jgi:pimeloyl-ACP methyl ester carboxylesterase
MSKLIKIILIVLILIMGIIFILTSTNAVLTSFEHRKYPAPGKLVIVHGNKMHVYSEGSGEKKIVLLSGLGTACPTIDFKPLIKALSTHYTVIVVEYFGYGWSDRTDEIRSTSNVVEETREALKLAGFQPPYILMPHSHSGGYSLLYANTYPKEIEAIIGLDIAVPRQASIKGVAPNLPFYNRFMELIRAFGIIRAAVFLTPGLVGFPDLSASFSNDDIMLIKTMTCWNYNNPTILHEVNMIFDKNNSEKLLDMIFPTNIPAIMVINKIPGFEWRKMHEDIISNNMYGKVIQLQGGHFIYYNHADQIKLIVDKLLKEDIKWQRGRIDGGNYK